MELPRAASPPAIYTSQNAQALRELPPPHVPGPRRILMIGGGTTLETRFPRSAELCFLAQGAAPGAVITFSCGSSALVTQVVGQQTPHGWEGFRIKEASPAAIAAFPFKRKASRRKFGGLKRTDTAAARKSLRPSSWRGA